MSRRDRRYAETPMSFFSFQDIISCTTGILILIALLLTLGLVTREGRGGGGPDVPTPDLEALARSVEDATQERNTLRDRVRRTREELEELARVPVLTRTMVDKLRARVGRLRQANAELSFRVSSLRKVQDTLTPEIQDLEANIKELKRRIAELEAKLKEEQDTVRVVLIGGEGSSKKPLLVECSMKEIRVGEVQPDGKPREMQRFRGDEPTEAFFRWAGGRPRDTEYFVLLIRPDAADEFEKLVNKLKYGLHFDVGWHVWPQERSLFRGP